MFAVTAASRIIRIDLRTLAEQEIVPATPRLRVQWTNHLSGTVPIGGVYELQGVNLPPIASARLFGQEQYVVRADSTSILLQVPYDSRQDAGWLAIVPRDQSQSPFELSAIWPYPFGVPWSAQSRRLWRGVRIAEANAYDAVIVRDARPQWSELSRSAAET